MYLNPIRIENTWFSNFNSHD